jgi:uncharacterized membrane protein
LIDVELLRRPFLDDLQRTLILSGFLFWAGLGQGLARQSAAVRFWRRWAQVAGAALLVSAGSRP